MPLGSEISRISNENLTLKNVEASDTVEQAPVLTDTNIRALSGTAMELLAVSPPVLDISADRATIKETWAWPQPHSDVDR